jgi:hypothetical protein
MSAQQADVRVGDTYQRPRSIGERRTLYGEPAAVASIQTMANPIQWGPVLGGIVTTMALLLILVSLGLAIGASAFKPGVNVTHWGTWAGIYGIASAVVAFFVGGWVAAKASATGGAFAAVINGFVSGAGALLLLVWMSSTSLVNLVGFIGANLAHVTNAVATAPVVTGSALAPIVTYGDAKTQAWVTFVVLAGLLVAATLGGLVGYHAREEEVIETTVAE